MAKEDSISEGTWWLIGSLSLLMFVGTLVLLRIVIVNMSADYFMPNRDLSDTIRRRHPVLRLVGIIAKNILGYLLIAAGIVMSVPLIPGQGFLTILIGLGLINFPGKRGFELWLVRRKAILRSINWIRERADQPPLQLPEEGELKPGPCSTDTAGPSGRG